VSMPGNALPKSELRLLGPFSLAIDGRKVHRLPRKADALLALLALQPGRPIARETVADFLWTDRGPAQARHSLRQTLVVLRRNMGDDVILAEGNSLIIPPGALVVDALEFEARATSADRDVLAETAALYRGELLENRGPVAPRFDDWLAVERSRFAALAATILRRLAAVRGAAGEFETAIAAAIRLLAIDNLREDSHRLLIELLARAGRRGEALRQFDVVTELLKRELGVRPDDETDALVRRIRMESSTPTATVSDAIDNTVTHAVRPPPVLDKPSIAVLPFQNMSGDLEQEYFVDGMVEEIITALSRIRWLLVIARNSSFMYQGRAVDVRQVGRELGVRYVLEGSVRKVGNLVRISAQADRRGQRRAFVGRSLRRLVGRDIRDPGSGSVERRRRHRARITGRRSRTFGWPPDRRSHSLRSLPARPRDDLVVGAANLGSAPRSGTGDRARPALRARARLGRLLLFSAGS
jgi:DNA-binding SARP family transcriptional activator